MAKPSLRQMCSGKPATRHKKWGAKRLPRFANSSSSFITARNIFCLRPDLRQRPPEGPRDRILMRPNFLENSHCTVSLNYSRMSRRRCCTSCRFRCARACSYHTPHKLRLHSPASSLWCVDPCLSRIQLPLSSCSQASQLQRSPLAPRSAKPRPDQPSRSALLHLLGHLAARSIPAANACANIR